MVDSSQEEVDEVVHLYLESRRSENARDPVDLVNLHLSDMPSSTPSPADETKEERALITPAPTLHHRQPLPEPQNGNDGNDCSAQASRSATDAIRQANQQASESIRQANQSASQGIQQANQSASQGIQQASISATNAIRQAENMASQSIAQFSRSSSSISSSASSAMVSAEQAISRANNSARSAMDNASQAIKQASAAVAAASGSAAASKFLENAARATQGQGTLPTYSEKAPSDPQATTSPTVAVTATQAAIAIVGSIIASILITFLVYFLFQRHRKRVNQRTQQNQEQWQQFNGGGGGGTIERKLSAASSSTAPSQFEGINKETRIEIQTTPAVPTTKRSPVSLSLFPKTPTSASFPQEKQQQPQQHVQQTLVPWNPTQPPPPPRLGTAATWLSTTAAGSIHLTTSQQEWNAPLGGQLKSPHFNNPTPSQNNTHQKTASTDLPLRDPPSRESQEWLKPAIRSTSVYPSASSKSAVLSFPPAGLPTGPRVRSASMARARGRKRDVPEYLPADVRRKYSLSKASVWGDEESDFSSGESRAGSRLGKDRERGSEREKGSGSPESRMSMRGDDSDRGGMRERERERDMWSEGIRTPDTAGIIASARMLDVKRGVAVGPSRLRVEEGKGRDSRAVDR